VSVCKSSSPKPVLVHLACDEVDWVAAVCRADASVVLTALCLIIHSATYDCGSLSWEQRIVLELLELLWYHPIATALVSHAGVCWVHLVDCLG
jgi:hypothetical protein